VSIPRALLLALALLQAVGVTDYVRRASCQAECKQDGCDDNGPCDSSSCACHCPGAPSLTETRQVAIDVPWPTTTLTVVFPNAGTLRTNPDPREILHVPKPYAV
jgi:hypothetical protein